jgi:outer membrane immunogenic protein
MCHGGGMRFIKKNKISEKCNARLIFSLKQGIMSLLILCTNTSIVVSANTTALLNKYNTLQSKDINWTGFYAGGVFGGVWEKINMEWNLIYYNPVYFVANQTNKNTNASGFTGGIVAGYNYQFTVNFIAGLDADWSWTNTRNLLVSSPWISTYTVTNPNSYTTMQSTLNYIPSLRAHVGYLLSSKIMTYAMAGVAWANMKYIANNNNGDSDKGSYITKTNFSKISQGYVTGGGLEWRIIQNFLLRAEYLYYKFNNQQSITEGDSTGNYPIYPSHYSWGITSINTIRMGLLYKFNA